MIKQRLSVPGFRVGPPNDGPGFREGLLTTSLASTSGRADHPALASALRAESSTCPAIPTCHTRTVAFRPKASGQYSRRRAHRSATRHLWQTLSGSCLRKATQTSSPRVRACQSPLAGVGSAPNGDRTEMEA